ncbi:universal stress protein [Actinokineospora guangxiensis]|uniref:Universal stress protein n=1 Tax=Actinokineospora guangxiensis TaxID=1490288 RepID=A0ABW0F0F8_9PSEU
MGARLLVVGSGGAGGALGRLFGSVSQAVLTQAPCPVAVVHRGASPAVRPSAGTPGWRNRGRR